MAKVTPRNFFHVQPLINDPAGDKWSLAADRNTRQRLSLLTVWYFKTMKAARLDARFLAKVNQPSEVLYHRLPRKNENPHLFPITSRDTYGSDPHPPAGLKGRK